jgi:methylated-DNA-[protein]-cysteine S-methyltransferase
MKKTQPETLTLDRIATPVGEVLLATDAGGAVRALDFADYEARMLRLLKRHYGVVELVPGRAPETVRAAVEAYFGGDARALEGVRVTTGGTPFQRAVWAALRTIPAGETWSYGRLASAIGKPSAVRAVGLANGANPVGIIVPCHRVIGANGTLTGYAGGVERKRWLLAHEGRSDGTGQGRPALG